MGNALAIAVVTAVLKNLLEKGLVSEAIVTSIGDVLVTALPPDRISVGTDERAQLNLFLYQVSQNRNADWMIRERGILRGSSRHTHPPLAIDLHYLLTAYGAKDFQAELLLGYAMQLLHETPTLTRDDIYTALKHLSSANTTSVFATAIASTSVAELADSVGQIKIGPEFFNMEETSKLWSALQTHYRPSTAYQASMVLIESRQSQQDTDKIPFQQPVIQQVSSLALGQPIVAGSTLVLRGQQLQGEITRIRWNQAELSLPQDIQDTQISLPVPANLKAGVQGVQVVHLPSNTTISIGVESNVAAFVLRPAIAVFVNQVQGSGDELRAGEITVKFKPKVGKEQKVVLLLNAPIGTQETQLEQSAYSFVAPTRTSDTDAIAFSFTGVPAGIYLVRVQVDGAESLLNLNSSGEYDSPQVKI